MTIGRIPSVEGGIQPTIVDAKGDILTATAADTPAVLAVGNNGDTLVADSSATTGLRWQGNFAAGKNAIINGDFRIWQRGTSFTATGYTTDRFRAIIANSCTFSQQTFTPGTAPVAGYEGLYYLRIARTTSTGSDYMTQKIEDVRTFAGQTVTLSFWAKADASTTMTALYLEQNFGSGGSGAVSTSFTAPTLTTSWARYSFTVACPSVSGKTIGTSSFLDVVWHFGSGMGNRTIEIWGVQLEAGNVATAFQTATGTLAGELAACQRYYYLIASGNNQPISMGSYNSTTVMETIIPFPVTMRTAPTISQTTGTNYYSIYRNSAEDYFNSLTLEYTSTTGTCAYNNSEISGTAGQVGFVRTTNASSLLAFSAEL